MTATTSASSVAKVTAKIQHEIVVVLGVAVTVSEAILTIVPSGSVTSTLQIALPLLVAAAARAKTVPLAKFNALLAQITVAAKPKTAAKS